MHQPRVHPREGQDQPRKAVGLVRKAKFPQRERLRFHSLRHTCASWLVMRSVPLRVVQAILGHSSVNVTERYSHLQPEVMEKAMEETLG